MTDNFVVDPVLFTTKEAAAILKLQPVTLARWRYRGEGPPYVRVGREARYEHGDLQAYIAAHRHDPSTSEPEG